MELKDADFWQEREGRELWKVTGDISTEGTGQPCCDCAVPVLEQSSKVALGTVAVPRQYNEAVSGPLLGTGGRQGSSPR